MTLSSEVSRSGKQHFPLFIQFWFKNSGLNKITWWFFLTPIFVQSYKLKGSYGIIAQDLYCQKVLKNLSIKQFQFPLLSVQTTPHLNKKNFVNKFSWDFEGGLDTIKLNWVCPENRFAAKSTGCGAIYCWKNDIPSNMSNLKNNAT